MNPIELMLVSKAKCFQTVIKPGPISGKLPASERLQGLKGHFILLPLDLSATMKQLNKNNLFSDAEDFVLCYDKPKKDRTYK